MTEEREENLDPRDNQVTSVYKDLPVQVVPMDNLLVSTVFSYIPAVTRIVYRVYKDLPGPLDLLEQPEIL